MAFAPAEDCVIATTTLRSIYTEDPGVRATLGFEPTLVARIARLSVPVMIGMLTQTAINQVDAAMVGRLDDRVAVAGTAAMGFALIVLWAIGGFLSAIAVGTQALVARRFGEGNQKGAGKVLTNSLVVALVTSALATAAALPAARLIFENFHPDPLVREVGTEYIEARFIGLFSMVTMASYKSFYDGLGRVRVHMTIAIIMNIINGAFCWLLVFGNWGFPRLEVAGAAWSSVIASVVGLVIMIVWTLRRQDRVAYRVYRPKNLDVPIMGTVARLSFFSGLAIVFAMTGFGLFYVIVGAIDRREGLAGVNTAATAAVINVALLLFMTCIAFGTATATLVAQSIGARKPDLAMRYGSQSVKIIVAAMSLLGAAAAAVPDWFIRVFLPKGGPASGDAVGAVVTGVEAQLALIHAEALKELVIHQASASLALCALGAPLAAAALVLAQALYGAGESRFVMALEGILHITCLVPLTYLFAIVLDYGLLGCWLAMGVYGVLLVVGVGWKFHKGDWTQNTL